MLSETKTKPKKTRFALVEQSILQRENQIQKLCQVNATNVYFLFSNLYQGIIQFLYSIRYHKIQNQVSPCVQRGHFQLLIQQNLWKIFTHFALLLDVDYLRSEYVSKSFYPVMYSYVIGNKNHLGCHVSFIRFYSFSKRQWS